MNNENGDAILRKVNDFTSESYRSLLEFLRKSYSIIPFREYFLTPDSKLILRHDVDGSMIPALRMAELENKFKIRSTFMVGFSMKFYNLFEETSFKMLRRISDLGHEIGLHYDALRYASYDFPPNKILKHELKALEMLTGKPVNVIARHNVSLSEGDPFEGSQAPLNAYNREFCEDALYVSDSCRAWCLRDLRRLLTKDAPRVQLLIHPMLWSELRCTRYELLDSFFRDLERMNLEYREYWQSFWRDSARVRTFDAELGHALN